jgi:hypothetical protein
MLQSVSIPCQRDIHNGNGRAYRASVRFDLFSSGRLLAALKEAGYPDLPAPRTLSWWIHNDAPPEALRVFVSEVVLQRKEAAPPEWAERLAAETARLVIEALAPGDLRQALDLLRERLATIQPLDGASHLGDEGDEAPGTAGPAGRGAGSRLAPEA